MEEKKKRKAPASMVQLSLAELRREGFLAEKVERWIPPRGEMKFGVRHDLFGFIDIIAVRADPPTTAAVQCSRIADLMAHWRKITELPEDDGTEETKKLIEIHRKIIRAAATWKAAGNEIYLEGWAKQGPRGEPKRWTRRREIL